MLSEVLMFTVTLFDIDLLAAVAVNSAAAAEIADVVGD